MVDALELCLDVVPVEGDYAEPAGATSFGWDVISDVQISFC